MSIDEHTQGQNEEENVHRLQQPRQAPLERLAFPATVLLVALLVFISFVFVEMRRSEIAVMRIELERELGREAQQIERLRVEKWPAPQATGQLSPPALSGPTNGTVGLQLLRDLISNDIQLNVANGGAREKQSTSAIASIVDALASAGQITATEAKSLKDDLQKAGVEIGVDAAKALIDRYIRGKEIPASGTQATSPVSQVTTNIMYCSANPIRTIPPRHQPTTQKRQCSAR